MSGSRRRHQIPHPNCPAVLKRRFYVLTAASAVMQRWLQRNNWIRGGRLFAAADIILNEYLYWSLGLAAGLDLSPAVSFIPALTYRVLRYSVGAPAAAFSKRQINLRYRAAPAKKDALGWSKQRCFPEGGGSGGTRTHNQPRKLSGLL